MIVLTQSTWIDRPQFITKPVKQIVWKSPKSWISSILTFKCVPLLNPCQPFNPSIRGKVFSRVWNSKPPSLPFRPFAQNPWVYPYPWCTLVVLSVDHYCCHQHATLNANTKYISVGLSSWPCTHPKPWTAGTDGWFASGSEIRTPHPHLRDLWWSHCRFGQTHGIPCLPDNNDDNYNSDEGNNNNDNDGVAVIFIIVIAIVVLHNGRSEIAVAHSGVFVMHPGVPSTSGYHTSTAHSSIDIVAFVQIVNWGLSCCRCALTPRVCLTHACTWTWPTKTQTRGHSSRFCTGWVSVG